MSKEHPQNGPSLSKAPPKKRQRIHGAPSPDREAAELDEANGRLFEAAAQGPKRHSGIVKEEVRPPGGLFHLVGSVLSEKSDAQIESVCH
jgi:hypothetical protein